MAEAVDISAERVARNQATFRAANEAIRESARAYDFSAPIPFVCECTDTACHELIRVLPAEYEQVRADARLFLNAEGHEAASGPHGRVVERRDGYNVVEKMGAAGDIVERLDPRREDGAA